MLCFFFNDTATTEIYPLPLHDALPILAPLLNGVGVKSDANTKKAPPSASPKLTDPFAALRSAARSEAHTPELQALASVVCPLLLALMGWRSSSRVTVRAPLPAWTVTRKVPSRAPSELKAAERSEERRGGKERRSRWWPGD